jgi:hypothetical protein
MPHPARTEELIDVVAQVAARVDDLVLEHVANGRQLPSERVVLELIEPDVTEALRVAFDDITATWTLEELDAATDAIMAELTVIVRRALRDAQSRRVEAASVAPDRLQDDDSVAGWVRAGAGLGAVLAAFWAKYGRPPKPAEVRYISATTGQPAPRRTAWQIKQVLRTRIAEERNTVAANVADRLGLVIRVEDARKGPTDEECEDVNGRYATTLWLRRHRVSHPNCTRRGRPAVLPSGQSITLLE